MVCFQAIEDWLPVSEHKLANMKPVSGDLDTLGEQLEELKVGIKICLNSSPKLVF